MSANEYHFVTHWRVESTLEEVSDVLGDALDLPRWWPSVYLAVKQIDPGGPDGIGRAVELHTKGWLPYTLRAGRFASPNRGGRTDSRSKPGAISKGAASGPSHRMALTWTLLTTGEFGRKNRCCATRSEEHTSKLQS